MEELREFYNKWKQRILRLSIIFWMIFTLFFLPVSSNIKEWLSNIATEFQFTAITSNEQTFLYVIDLLIGFAAPTTMTWCFFTFFLRNINERHWKKKFPQYDVSGEWEDTTLYTDGFNLKGKTSMNKSKPVYIKIKQTCQSIEVLQSTGEGFTWYSVLAGWEGKTLNILYAVEYYESMRKEGFPEKRFGYESMHIDSNELAAGKRPTKMIGKFWHCISDDGKPIYMGDVQYVRKS